MHLRLHKNATTTPRIRAEIQVSKEPMRVLAQRFGVSVCTIARWKKRASVHDASHTPHRLQTTLTPAQESIVLVLRKSLGLSLDDLLAVVREFIHPTVSRAALHRMLKRHGVSAREALSVDRPRTKPFKAYEPGFVHIDVKYLPQMADETTRRYLFVAIDRATRWVFVRVYASKSATNARRFLKELHKAAAFRIRTILTDNGKEFTDRFITRGERTPTGRHQFDQLCEELGIEHRLTRPKHPQTNGMVERFNGRIADILRTHHFHCGEELEATILRYVWLYNHQLPQKALGHVSPIQAMKQWQRSHPELFNRRVTNQPGHDTYDELRYILDPTEIYGEDYPSETFRVLKNNEIKQFGEYRTRRLVLDAWDRIERGELAAPSPAIRIAAVRTEPVDVSTLPDGAWARPMVDPRAETGVQLAAILKAMAGPLPTRQVRLAALLTLEPRLLLPYLDDDEAATWRRLIGTEADPLPPSTPTFVARVDAAWGTAVRNLRTNGHLVEDIQAGTWAPAAGLDRFATDGWPDGRARMVLQVLQRQATDTVIAALPTELRDWVDAAAA